MKIVLILGSARSDGKTGNIVDLIHRISGWDVIDLKKYEISQFDYEHKNKGDDYLPLIRRIITEYDVFIFATPVYWYSMSGIMKVFFDRFTDLLDFEKELGRKLRTKSMAAISTSVGGNLEDNFWLPFSESAKYLGMKYFGNAHFIIKRDESKAMQEFIEMINEKSNELYSNK